MRTIFVVAAFMFLSVSGTLGAIVQVGVGYFSLSPNPVTISAGDSVYWYEADEDFGPYMITLPAGYFFTPGGVTFQNAGTYSYTADSAFGGGGWGGTVIVNPGTPNTPPTVDITSPTNHATFTAPASFDFEAAASDPDPDDLWDVEFWVGEEMVDDDYSPPFSTRVTNLPAGTHTLTAIVWDYALNTATNSVTITVTAPAITLSSAGLSAGKFVFSATGLSAGKTNVLQRTLGLGPSAVWTPLATNLAAGTTASYTNDLAPGAGFFRLVQLP